MNKMKFVVYGVEVHSPVTLPLDISEKRVWDHVLRLQFNTTYSKKDIFEYYTPAVEIHGRKTQLFSNMPFASSRLLNERTWKIDIGGLFSFMWSNSSDIMTIEYEKKLDLEKLSFWLLHTIIPIYLILKQSSLLFHASVVEVNKKAILFIAPSFGGKSTLADFFIGQGHCLLSDDKVRLEYKNEGYLVYPAYPYRRPYRELETLGKYTGSFSVKPLPLGNIYFVNLVDPKDACSIESIQGLNKFEVLNNAYLYEPVSMSRVEMEYLMNLVHHCFLYRANIPKDLTHLPKVYQTIIAHEAKKELSS